MKNLELLFLIFVSTILIFASCPTDNKDPDNDTSTDTNNSSTTTTAKGVTTSTVRGTTTTTSGGGNFTLTEPKNVKAVASSTSSILITWNKVANATSYKVYRSDTTSGTYNVRGNNVTKTNYEDTELSVGATWYYKVTAHNADGELSNYSLTVSATLPSTDPILDTPANVSAVAMSYKIIEITWDEVEGATTYTIYRSENTGTYKTYDEVDAPTLSFEDKVLLKRTYSYKVSAENSSMTSSQSSPSSVTISGLPNGIAVAPVKTANTGAWSFIDKDGDIIYNFANGYEVFPFSQGLARVSRNYDGQVGFIDRNFEKKIDYIYKDAYGFSDGAAAVQSSDFPNYWGYIDTTGDPLFATIKGTDSDTTSKDNFKLVNAKPFSEGYALVLPENDDWKWGYINKQGITVYPNYTNNFKHYKDSSSYTIALNEPQLLRGAPVFTKWDGNNPIWIYLDLSSISPIVNTITLDYRGGKVSPYTCRPFYNGLAAVNFVSSSYLWGFISINDIGSGNRIEKTKITPQYKEVKDFSEGFAAVQSKDAPNYWGFIDTNGDNKFATVDEDTESEDTEAIEFKYKEVDSFKEGFAVVKDANDKWGFIDNEGKEIIPLEYYGAKSFGK